MVVLTSSDFSFGFRNQEDLENENSRDIPGYRDPELSAVRRAIETFTGFKAFGFAASLR